jgi:hypothetical protein
MRGAILWLCYRFEKVDEGETALVTVSWDIQTPLCLRRHRREEMFAEIATEGEQATLSMMRLSL